MNGELALTSFTLAAIPRVLGNKLLALELTDTEKFSDSNFASMVNGLPSLTTLVLRYMNELSPIQLPKLKIVVETA